MSISVSTVKQILQVFEAVIEEVEVLEAKWNTASSAPLPAIPSSTVAAASDPTVPPVASENLDAQDDQSVTP